MKFASVIYEMKRLELRILEFSVFMIVLVLVSRFPLDFAHVPGVAAQTTGAVGPHCGMTIEYSISGVGALSVTTKGPMADLAKESNSLDPGTAYVYSGTYLPDASEVTLAGTIKVDPYTPGYADDHGDYEIIFYTQTGDKAIPKVSSKFLSTDGLSHPFKFTLPIGNQQEGLQYGHIEITAGEEDYERINYHPYLWIAIGLAPSTTTETVTSSLPPATTSTEVSETTPTGNENGTLRVDITDDNTRDYCEFTVRVFELETNRPIANAKLEIRIFYVYDYATKQWINGQYRDHGPYYTNGIGQFKWTWQWHPTDAGNMWRIDVYASKEGYNNDDVSTHITGGAMSGPGEGPYTTATTQIRLRVDVQDDNTATSCKFTVRVVESDEPIPNFETDKPIPDARLIIRVFHLYDSSNNQWINGEYKDNGPYYTDSGGQKSWTWTWTPGDTGDVWRIDVYASKDGYTDDDAQTTVTGGAIAMMMATNTTGNISEQPTLQNPTYLNENALEKPPFQKEQPALNAIQSQIPGGYSTVVGIVALVAIGSFLLGRRFPPRKKQETVPPPPPSNP
jgi:hypothetical protein